MLSFGVKGYLSPWLLPPVSLFLLVALGLLVGRRWRIIGRLMVGAGLVAGIVLSMPLVAGRLIAWVEAPYERLDPPPLRLPAERQVAWRARPDEAPQAIVVLSGGTAVDGAGSSQPNRIGADSLERILHARRVALLTGLPLLITGGVTHQGGEPEAQLMREVSNGDLATPVRWVETKSRDTSESAAFTLEMLQPLGIRRVLLVTHAYHMRRAQWAFEGAGFAVTPAPHSFMGRPMRLTWLSLVPSIDAVTASRHATREILGHAWYRLLAVLD